MKKALGLVSLFAICCARPSESRQPIAEEIAAPEFKTVAAGETVYVPAYARVHHLKLKDRTAALVTTLAIHNTDLERPLVLRSVKYYAENGQLLHEYIKRARLLPPLATAIYYLAPEDAGKTGIGANAVVEWVAEKPVSKPLIESIMVSTDSTLGISFVSPGYTIKKTESKP